MKEKLKTVYVCTNCGEVSARWMGKCLSCNSWNTIVEDVVREDKKGKNKGKLHEMGVLRQMQALQDVDTCEERSRLTAGIAELNRVLGGGIVLGSVVLLGGEPGAGKSTLLLQVCGAVAQQTPVLYISGEESVRQIKLRAQRLQVQEEGISVAAEADVDEITAYIEKEEFGFVVIDSIQTMYTQDLSGSAGSVSQVKECTARLLSVAKSKEIPVFIVGHVNKDGAIAGPKVLEHIVDTVLYFEGERGNPYRILRAVKNRYGSTNEIGLFDMTGQGLQAIENPSEMLLAGRPLGVSGNCVTCLMEGSRPLLSEVQAIATKTSFGTPRRATSGVDIGRTNLLLAVLEKRAGFSMGNLDIYLNVVGGLEIDETASDLCVCLAIVSSLLDKPLADDLLVLGEVGLGGEVRSVSNMEMRLREAQRIGFASAIIPSHNLSKISKDNFAPMRIKGAGTIQQAIACLES